MNEHSNEILPNLLRQDAFATVKKGYDKSQVDDYVVRNHNQVRDIEERLARAHDELERMRRELAEAKEKAAVKPEHEQLSERLTSILRIAEEEAEEKRVQVDQEIQRIREESTKDSKRLVKDAEAHAERILGSAREQAQELVTSAKQEAEQLRAQSQQDAERMIADAEQRAQKINDAADHRLATLTATHSEAVRRITEMRDTFGKLLDAEASAEPLESAFPKAAPAKRPIAKPAAPAAKPAAKPEAKQPAAKPEPKPADKQPAAKEQPTAQAPAKPEGGAAQAGRGGSQMDDPSTVRLGMSSAAKQETSQPSAVRNSPPRPQGFRYDAPAPGGPKGSEDESPTQEVKPPAKPEAADDDPGITGVYKRPEGSKSNPPDEDETEEVRIIPQ